MYHLWPQTEYIIILLCKTYNFVQCILCRTTKMQLDIAFLTNRENIQKFLKKLLTMLKSCGIIIKLSRRQQQRKSERMESEAE